MILLVAAVNADNQFLIMGNTISNWWVPTGHESYGQGGRAAINTADATTLSRDNWNTKASPDLIASGWTKLDLPVRPQVGEGTEESKECCELPSTTMMDDGCAMSNQFRSLGTMDLLVSQETSIQDFMKKPFLTADISWTTSDVSNTILGSSTVNVRDLYATLNTFWADKIEGFAMVTGDVVCHLKLNAMPFQQGMLLLHFLPNYVQRIALDSSFGPMHNANLTTKTQQPSVMIDARDTTAILSMPYVAPTNYAKLASTSERYDWGTYFLSVLSPLMVTGDAGVTEVDCSMYFYFENFKLVGPTVPQSGAGAPMKKFKNASVNRESGVVSDHGPITKALSLTAQAASSLSSIPLLSSVTEPLSWALRVASGVASVFGWAKPQNNGSTAYVSRAHNKYAAVCDGDDPSYTLGLLHDNAVLMTDINSIRRDDEMSFNFLKKIPAYMGVLTDWNTTVTSGTSLFSRTMNPIGPSGLWVAGSTTYGSAPVHTATWLTAPPACHLANFFAYYRGGFEITFKVVSTVFHSGRLQFTFTPTGYGSVTHPTLTTANIALREIIDIRTGNVVKFRLPWYLATNYLPVNQSIGTVDVLVLNELKCPASVSPHVNIIWFINGADDFELAGPGANFLTASGATTPYPFSPQCGVMPQAGGSEEVIIQEAIGGQGTTDFSTVHSVHSMGELFTSVKQLISRQASLRVQTYTTGSGFEIWPWFVSVLSMNNSTGVIQHPIVGADIFSVIAPMYAFYKGSMRIGFRQPTSSTACITAFITPTRALNTTGAAVYRSLTTGPSTDANADWGPLDSSVAATLNTGFLTTDQGIGAGIFRVPYYCQTKSSLLLCNSTATANIPSDISQPSTVLNVQVLGSTFGSGTGVAFSRAAADDFQFSYFLGTTPLITNYV